MPSYLDQHNRHTVQIQRFATKLLNAQVYPSMAEAYKAARAILSEYDDITSITQLNKITRDINKAVDATMTEGWAVATGEMDDLAVYEASYYAGLISKTADVALSVPANEKILRYINRSLLSLESGTRTTSGLWSDLVRQNTDSMMRAYDNAVRAAYANGETIAQTTKRLRDINNGFLKSDAESLARTGVQHYAIQARQAMVEDNKNVIEREVPVVTFDNRTSLTCLSIGSRYGIKGWPRGKSPVGVAPFHFQCRTTMAYLVKGQSELEGMRTAVGGKKGEAAADAYELRKDRKRTDGKVTRRGRKDDSFFDPKQVRAGTPIDNFVRSQPIWYQESLPGKKRADLFRKGDLSLGKFTDATARPLTLKELAAVDVDAFRKAGLEV